MRTYIVFIITLLVFQSCTQNDLKKNVSHIPISIEILPHHTDIYALSKNYSEQAADSIYKKYGTFAESYNTRILQLPPHTDTAYKNAFSTLFAEKWVQDLYKKINEEFPDNSYLVSQLTPALQYYAYYFPEKEIPRFASFMGLVQFSVVIDSNLIAIGLDKYLGTDYDMYKAMEMSTFVRRTLYKEKIAADVMRAIAESEFSHEFTEHYLLAHIIQHGRYMYFVKCMLPETPDSVIWGYTDRQLTFCKKSEKEFWRYFVSTENTLFSSDFMTIKRFIDDGPFTPVFTKESPAKIGQWIGYRIVESYMKHNPETTLFELFAIESAQEIMSKSKYNP